jgi:5'-nucleotidase
MRTELQADSMQDSRSPLPDKGRSSHRFRQAALAGGVALACAAVALSPLASGPASAQISGAGSLTDTVTIGEAKVSGVTSDIHVLAFNDLHGHLDGSTSGNLYGRYAGGAAALGRQLGIRQRQYKGRSLTVFAGDAIGATPLASALFEDEPTVVALNLMGVDFASVGNHEFDRGRKHLQRMQDGGCEAACVAAPYPTRYGGFVPTFPGAEFTYLAANVKNADGSQFLKGYATKKFTTIGGTTVKVGVIGAVLEATPTIVTPSGVAGLKFVNETKAANEAAAALLADGVKTNVLVIHQGGAQSSAPTKPGDCVGALAGSDIEKIVKDLDKSIRVIVSGHTHQEYRCIVKINGVDRLITSASSQGRIMTDITMNIDDLTGELISASAANVLVENATNPNTQAARIADPLKAADDLTSLATYYQRLSAPKANRVVGTVKGDMSNTTTNPNGESPLGDVIADAQLASTKTTGKAQIAFMNPGGIRAPGFQVSQISAGEKPGEITYAEAFTVQPFGNSLVTMTLTGDQIRALLEQQFTGCRAQITTRILQVSQGFSYEQTPAATECAKKIGAITLDGKALDAKTNYRVTVNSFLATGGDGFVVLNDGTERVGGEVDIDALIAYFAANPAGIAPGAATRIVLK